MRILRKLFIFVGLIILLVTLVAWKTPASWIADKTDLARKGASFARVTGTFWAGEAEQVEYRDLMLGDVKWNFLTLNQLNPVTTTWKIDGTGHDYDIELLMDTQGRQVKDLRLIQGHVPAGWIDLNKYAPMVVLTGRLNLDLDHASPTGDTSRLATGLIHWTDAGLDGLVEENLGTITIQLRSENRFTIADIQSDPEAEIRLDGQFRINGREYITELELQVVEEKQYVIDQLAELGTINENGSLQINRSGRVRR